MRMEVFVWIYCKISGVLYMTLLLYSHLSRYHLMLIVNNTCISSVYFAKESNKRMYSLNSLPTFSHFPPQTCKSYAVVFLWEKRLRVLISKSDIEMMHATLQCDESTCYLQRVLAIVKLKAKWKSCLIICLKRNPVLWISSHDMSRERSNLL